MAAATLAVLFLGVLIRAWNFAGGRSLWHDEAMIGMNLVYLPMSRLFGQLNFDQIAPVGWLFLEKAIYLVWPDVDYGLRLVSFVVGVASVFVAWRLARSMLGPWEALLATAVFAVASPLIQYSAMVKPYVLDAFFAATILLLAQRLILGAVDRRVGMALLFVTGAAGVTLAFGALPVMASTGLVLAVVAFHRRDWRWLALLAVTGTVWLAIFAATHVFSYSTQARTVSNMTAVYWTAAFAPPPVSLEAMKWYARAARSLIEYLHGAGPVALPAALALVGVAGFRRRPATAALLVGPFAFSLLASAARAYPFDSRFQLGLAAPFFILAAHGAWTLADLAGRRLSPRAAGVAFAVLAVAVLAPSLSASVRRAAQSPPWAWEEIKPNLERLASQRRPDDLVLISIAAERPLLIYADRYGFEGMDYRVMAETRGRPECVALDSANLPATGRVWVLTFHERPSEAEGARRLRAELVARGPLVLAGNEPGSRLYRVDLRRARSAGAVPAHCSASRLDMPFLHEVASRHRMEQLAPSGRSRIGWTY